MVCLLVVDVHDVERFAFGDDGYVFVVEVYDLVGIFDDGAGVASEEELILSYADDERAALSSSNDLVWIVFVEYGYGIGSDDSSECYSDSCQQISLFLSSDVVNELHEHFRVRVAVELDAFLLQQFFQECIVLYYAVMDDGEVARERHVWVSVVGVRFTVSGPSRMRYAYAARCVFVGRILLQVCHLSFCLVYSEVFIVVEQSYSGAVVTSIFQSLQSLDENRVSFSFSYVSYDSTHVGMMV